MLVVCSGTSYACAPVIAHGPQVQRGLSAGTTLVIANGPTYENGDDPGPFLFGTLSVNAAYGWRPADGRAPAVRIGVQTSPLGVVGTDVYVQAPPRWLGLGALGVGVHSDGGVRHMPYLQAGLANRDGYGAHLVAGRYAYRFQGKSFTLDENAAVGWLSAQIPLGAHVTAHLHGGYARGHAVKRSYGGAVQSDDPYIDEDRWSTLGGATFELHRPRR